MSCDIFIIVKDIYYIWFILFLEYQIIRAY